MIHYHGTPTGGTRRDPVHFLRGRHALIPWPRPEDLPISLEVCQSVMLDNGAFTAWKQGQPVQDWGGYYQWVLSLCKHPAFDFAVIPDVIDENEQANDELLAEWCSVVYRKNYGAPVWHIHESLERLDRLVDQWDRVCLGSSGEFSSVGTDKWWRRMSEAMDVACDAQGRPRCKLHGLRMLNAAVFTCLPLASADSTNAVRNSSSYTRFGQYLPPTAAQRMEVIATRIEAHQSRAIWVKNREQQGVLYFLDHGATDEEGGLFSCQRPERPEKEAGT